MEPLVPAGHRVISGSALKVIATLAMFIDHTAAVLLRGDKTVLFSILGKSITPYYVMRLVGRIAFPIFAFLLVEGFVYTHDRKKYGLRLAVFALISEIPWNLEHTGKLFHPASQSVFVTLFIAFLGLCLVERLQTARERSEYLRPAALLAGLFVVACLAHADYGARGLAMVLALYLLRELHVVRAVVASGMLGNPLASSCAFVPIAFYNGKRGFIQSRPLQLLFYVVYPLHMLILYSIRLRTVGY